MNSSFDTGAKAGVCVYDPGFKGNDTGWFMPVSLCGIAAVLRYPAFAGPAPILALQGSQCVCTPCRS